MNVKDLCGSDLCMTPAACSYVMQDRRVYLCQEHLVLVAKQSGHKVGEQERLLPGFEWERACSECGSFDIGATESACRACSVRAARELSR